MAVSFFLSFITANISNVMTDYKKNTCRVHHPTASCLFTGRESFLLLYLYVTAGKRDGAVVVVADQKSEGRKKR